jgi:argininosuccinate synthase
MKIVLAYSGGLDTSVLMSWIKEKYNAEMIGFCADIGQEEELDGLEAKAIKTGASKIYIDNLQEEFARDFIYPMLRAGAIYEGQYFSAPASRGRSSPSAWSRSPRRKRPTPSRTVPPARAMTRSASS